MIPGDFQLISNTFGAIGNAEARLLYESAKKVPADQVIVEIGSWRGKSTVALALGSLAGNSVKVFSIDPHEKHEEAHEGGLNYGPDDWHLWAEAVSKAGCWEVVRPIGLPSAILDYAFLFGTGMFPAVDLKVGLAFVDGSHLHEDVLADLKNLDDTQGPIICDDVGMQGVAAAISGFCDEYGWSCEEYGAFAILRKEE